MQRYYSDCSQQLQLTEEYNIEKLMKNNDELDSSFQMALLIQDLHHAIEQSLTNEPNININIPSNAVVTRCLENYRQKNPHRSCKSWLWDRNMVLHTNEFGNVKLLPDTCLIFIFGASKLPAIHVDQVNPKFLIDGNKQISYRLCMENEKDLVGLVEDGDMAVVYKVDGCCNNFRLNIKLYIDVIKYNEWNKIEKI